MAGSGEERKRDLFEGQIVGGGRRARRSRKRRARQLKKRWGNAFTILCCVALLTLVAAGLWVWRAGQEADGKAGEPGSPAVLEWHEGGTLHQATVRAWRAASYRDRLATSADLLSLFMELSGWTHLRINPDRGEFREIAEGLEAMIGETGRADQTVEDSAASCWTLLERQWR